MQLAATLNFMVVSLFAAALGSPSFAQTYPVKTSESVRFAKLAQSAGLKKE